MRIFDTSGFVTRLQCGTSWTVDLIALDIMANLIIIFGYSITTLRVYNLYRCQENNKDIIGSFILFPLFCGFSRIAAITVYWWAPYRFYILLNWLCAFGVTFLAFNLKKTLARVLKHPTLISQMDLNKSLKDEIKIREQTQFQLNIVNQQLITSIGRLETILQNELWIHDRKKAIDELNLILKDLSSKFDDG